MLEKCYKNKVKLLYLIVNNMEDGNRDIRFVRIDIFF